MKLKNILKILTIIFIICSCFAINNSVNAGWRDWEIYDGARADGIENGGWITPFKNYAETSIDGETADFISFEYVDSEGMKIDSNVKAKLTVKNGKYCIEGGPIVATRTALAGEECWIKIKMCGWVADSTGRNTDYDEEVYIVDYENYLTEKEDLSEEFDILEQEEDPELSHVETRSILLARGKTVTINEEDKPEISDNVPRVFITKMEEKDEEYSLREAAPFAYEMLERKGELNETWKRTFRDEEVDVPEITIRIGFARLSARPKMGTEDGYSIFVAGETGKIKLIYLKPMETSKMEERMVEILNSENEGNRVSTKNINDPELGEMMTCLLSCFGKRLVWSDCFTSTGGWFEEFAKDHKGDYEKIKAKENMTINRLKGDETFTYEIQKDHLYNLRYHFVYNKISSEVYTILAIAEVDENGNVIETNEDALEMEEAMDRVDEYTASVLANIAAIRNAGRHQYSYFYDVLEDTNNYKPESLGEAPQATTFIGTTLRVVTNIGIIIAIVMLAILGIKYMLGSIEEKAEYKRDLLPYMIGAVLLFGISFVMKIMMAFGDNINNI